MAPHHGLPMMVNPLAEWSVSESAVKVDDADDGMLGRGAFGEVRKCQWRGMQAVFKLLHTINEDVRPAHSAYPLVSPPLSICFF